MDTTRRGRTRAPGVATRAAMLVLAASLVSLVLVAVGPTTVRAEDDLQDRLAAACARVPVAADRVEAAIARLDGPADQRGSLAWFAAAVERATDNGRSRIAADLQRRLDRLTERRSVLDTRMTQLERYIARCAELGVPA